MKGRIDNPEIENGYIKCPNCRAQMKACNGSNCACGVKLHCYKDKSGKISRINWCGPSKK